MIEIVGLGCTLMLRTWLMAAVGLYAFLEFDAWVVSRKRELTGWQLRMTLMFIAASWPLFFVIAGIAFYRFLLRKDGIRD